MSVFRTLLMQQDVYDTIYGTNSITFNAKANGLKALKLFGGTEQSGTPTPTTPQNIVSNNGAIKYSPNLVNMVTDNVDLGHYISANGVYSESVSNFLYVPYIKVQPNTTYTLSFSEELYYITISEYSANDRTGFIQRNEGTTGGNTSLTITTQATTQYIRFGSNPYGNSNTVTMEQVLAINWMLAKADTPQTYIPYGQIYTDGTVETITDSLSNTATAEMLLKVSTYQDIQEVIAGRVTRNVGIKVLTGDNTKDGLWGTSAGASNLYSLTIANSSTDNTFSPISTHFVGVLGNVGYASIQDGQFKHGSNSNTYFFKDTNSENVTEFKAFLATQYAAGTPVIVVYPLSTPTTETVTGQHLTTQEGNNTISITQASINNLELEGKYKRRKMQELPFTQPILTADGTLGGDSFAVSAPYFSTYYTYYPFASNANTNSARTWAYNANTADYIFYNPDALKVSSIDITNRNESSPRPIVSGTVYGSNDGTTWTELTTFTNTVKTSNTMWTLTVNSSAFYKYHKISGVSGSTGYIGIGKIGLHATYMG